MNFGIYLARSAQYWPDKAAVLFQGRALTYRELEERSNRLAHALRALGLQKGDRVAIVSPNRPDIVVAECAFYKLGLVKVALNSRLSPQELEDALTNAEPQACLVGPAHRPVVHAMRERLPSVKHALAWDCTGSDLANGWLDGMVLEAQAPSHHIHIELSPDDLAVLHYTSGSTGKLKAAMQTMGNRMTSLRKVIMGRMQSNGNDVMLLVGPITHASGMFIQAMLFQGVTILLLDRFHPAELLQAIEKHRVTMTFMVPAMIHALLAEPSIKTRDLSSLRLLSYGAAPMSPARIREAWAAFGPVLAQGYGAGETTGGIISLTIADHARAIHGDKPELLSACGRAVCESEVQLLGDDGQPVEGDAIGEICVRGPDVFAGYWRAPEITRTAFDAKGWLHTGDLARVDSEGYIYIVDRKKEMLVSGGFNIYPSEIESVLAQHPAVYEVCVVGVPDAHWGEVVKAVVVLRQGTQADEQTLIEFCRTSLADFKKPRSVDFVHELPKNSNGKLSRKDVRERYWQGREQKGELSMDKKPSPDTFEGSAKAREFISRLSEFVETELRPLAQAHGVDHENAPSRELLQQVWQRSQALGFYGMTLPEAMGGAGFTVHDHALIKEFIYASGTPFAPHVLGELTGPPRLGALVRQATPEQMQRFILPVARAEKAVCFAITEPDAGSDAGALQTSAVQDGDHFVLSGTKKFISGSPFCDFAVIIASTSDDPAVRETTAFFVERDRPGFAIEGGYKTMAGQSHTANIVLKDCRIPLGNQIGERGKGLALALGRITVNRLLHCPAMLGLAELAMQDSLQYARQRKQFGQPIGAFQSVQHMLADMATELAAARALMLSVARQLDLGVDARAQASMAKLFCSETAFRVADLAVQIHGGEGIVQGRRVEFLFRMLRMYRVLTGTSEIQRNTIARELLQPASH